MGDARDNAKKKKAAEKKGGKPSEGGPCLLLRKPRRRPARSRVSCRQIRSFRSRGRAASGRAASALVV